MRQILIGETELSAGRVFTCRYHLLVRSLPPPVCCESYGIGAAILQSGEREEVWDITVRPEKIQELADLVLRNGVTPCTLREIVEDWLG